MAGLVNSAARLEPEGILARLRQVAREDLELAPEQIESLTLDQSLADGFGLDSLRQVVLIARIEDIYGFEFRPEDQARLAALRTLRDLVDLVAERASGRPA